MNNLQVNNILTRLGQAKRINISKKDASFLGKYNLIDVIPQAEYSYMKLKADSLNQLETQGSNLNNRIKEGQIRIDELNQLLGSPWHLNFTRKINLEKERSELQTLIGSMVQNTDAYKRLIIDIEERSHFGEILEGYVDSPIGAIRINDKGTRRNKYLNAAGNELNSGSFDNVERKISDLETKVSQRYLNFKGSLAWVENSGTFGGYDESEEFALAISLMPFKESELFTKIKIADKYFRLKLDADTSHYESFRIIAQLLNAPGNLSENLNIVNKLYSIAIANEHSDSYETLFEQAICLEINEPTPQKKWERYQAMDFELGKNGWEKGESATCYIAGNLSKKKGDVPSIVNYFKTLNLGIVKKGFEKGIASGIAALILYDMEGTIEQKSTLFRNAWNTMINEFGWEDNSDNYAACALLCLVPGEIGTKLALVDYVKGLFQQDPKEFGCDINYMATSLVMGMHRNLIDMSQPYTHSSHGHVGKYGVGAEGRFRILDGAPYHSPGIFG
ncbi:MAG: hypothetical protein AABW92_03005 [Nanoarchaeota archaeon]